MKRAAISVFSTLLGVAAVALVAAYYVWRQIRAY